MSFKKVKIKNLVRLINGYSFKPEDWRTEGEPIIRIQNLNNPEGSYNLTDKKIPEKFVVRKGDILIAWSGSLGVYEWKSEHTALLNQHIYKVEFKSSEIEKSYFKYVINQALIELEQKARGVGLKHLKKAQLAEYEFVLPEIEEQEKAVAVLNKINILKSKREKTIGLLLEYLDSSFLNLFGDPITNTKGWPTYKIKNLGKIVTGNTPPKERSEFYAQNFGNDTLPWLKSNNIQIDKFFNSNAKERLNITQWGNSKIVPANSILIISISGSNSRLGDCCLTKEQTSFNQQISAFVPNKYPFFFYWLIRFYKPLFQNSAAKGVKSLLTKSSLENIEVIFPPKELELQAKFEEVLLQAIELHHRLITSKNILNELFQGVIYHTFKKPEKQSKDNIDILFEDHIQLELFLNTIKSSAFENEELYNHAVNDLFEILDRTQANNKHEPDNLKGLIQKISDDVILLETNKEHKYRIIDEATQD